MEETEGKVDSMNRKPAVAAASGTVDLDIVEHKVLELLDSPGREHYPCEDGVDEEEEGVSDTSRDTVGRGVSRVEDGRG